MMGHNHSKPVCPVVNTSGPDIQPLVKSLTFHSVSIIVSGAAAIFSSLIALFLIICHATHFSNPPEQKQVIRVITVIPAFSLISFLCVWLNGNPQPYLVPGLDLGESLPMGSFFLLISTYIIPDEAHQDSFWEQLELIDKKGNPQRGGSLLWYRRLSFGVLQFIPVSIVLWIATAISLAADTYCITSNKPHFAHIWITLIRMFSTAFAIISIFKLYKRSRSTLKPRGTMKQFFCFKILIFLNFVQTFVFNFLMTSGHLHANKYLTFNDLSKGLPSLILSCEIAIIVPFFLHAYSYAPYILGRPASVSGSQLRYHGGRFGITAILSALNIVDIVSALVLGVKAKASSAGRNVRMGGVQRPDQRY